MAETTVIRNAAWVAAWNEGEGAHEYLRDADVAFRGDTIVHVGPGFSAPADARVVDGARRFVMPGLLDLHAHPHTEPANKGIREDHGRPEMYDTGLYERACAFSLDEEGRRAAAELAYAELLAGGVTTVMDLSTPCDGWLDLLAGSGLRGYVAPAFASARWYLDNLHDVKFAWDEKRGEAEFARAIEVIERAEQHPSGRLAGVVYPAQIDTCTEALLRDAAALARESGRVLTTHASQSKMEFLEMVRRHGVSPLQWAHDIGFLGPNAVVGHAIFIDEHPMIGWRSHRDLALLADTCTSVAHCPSPFARYGHAMADFGRYRRAGVNLGIGTDVAPHSVIEEMRLAIILGRVMAEDVRALDTGEVFRAATVGAAKALGRDDLGRIAPGAKADLVLVDLDAPSMRPVRDPLRTLVYEAADRAVRDVYVGGELVVAERRVLNLDPEGAGERLERAQARMLEAVPRRDFLHRTAEQIAPLSLPRRQR